MNAKLMATIFPGSKDTFINKNINMDTILMGIIAPLHNGIK